MLAKLNALINKKGVHYHHSVTLKIKLQFKVKHKILFILSSW